MQATHTQRNGGIQSSERRAPKSLPAIRPSSTSSTMTGRSSIAPTKGGHKQPITIAPSESNEALTFDFSSAIPDLMTAFTPTGGSSYEDDLRPISAPATSIGSGLTSSDIDRRKLKSSQLFDPLASTHHRLSLSDFQSTLISGPDSVKKGQSFSQSRSSLASAGQVTYVTTAVVQKPSLKDISHLADEKSTSQRDVFTSTVPLEDYVYIKSEPLLDPEELDTVIGSDGEKYIRVFPSRRPTGRAEAIHLQSWFERKYKEISQKPDAKGSEISLELEKLLTCTLNEVARQVSVTCLERGIVLNKIWSLHKTVTNQILDHNKFLMDEVEKYRNQISIQEKLISSLEAQVSSLVHTVEDRALTLHATEAVLRKKEIEFLKKQVNLKAQVEFLEKKEKEMARVHKETLESEKRKYENEAEAAIEEIDKKLMDVGERIRQHEMTIDGLSREKRSLERELAYVTNIKNEMERIVMEEEQRRKNDNSVDEFLELQKKRAELESMMTTFMESKESEESKQAELYSYKDHTADEKHRQSSLMEDIYTDSPKAAKIHKRQKQKKLIEKCLDKWKTYVHGIKSGRLCGYKHFSSQTDFDTQRADFEQNITINDLLELAPSKELRSMADNMTLLSNWTRSREVQTDPVDLGMGPSLRGNKKGPFAYGRMLVRGGFRGLYRSHSDPELVGAGMQYFLDRAETIALLKGDDPSKLPRGSRVFANRSVQMNPSVHTRTTQSEAAYSLSNDMIDSGCDPITWPHETADAYVECDPTDSRHGSPDTTIPRLGIDSSSISLFMPMPSSRARKLSARGDAKRDEFSRDKLSPKLSPKPLPPGMENIFIGNKSAGSANNSMRQAKPTISYANDSGSESNDSLSQSGRQSRANSERLPPRSRAYSSVGFGAASFSSFSGDGSRANREDIFVNVGAGRQGMGNSPFMGSDGLKSYSGFRPEGSEIVSAEAGNTGFGRGLSAMDSRSRSVSVVQDLADFDMPNPLLEKRYMNYVTPGLDLAAIMPMAADRKENRSKVVVNDLSAFKPEDANQKATLGIPALRRVIFTILDERVRMQKMDPTTAATSVPQFVYDSFAKRYGLKAIAQKNLRNLIKALLYFREKDHLVHTFCRYCGLVDMVPLECFNFVILTFSILQAFGAIGPLTGFLRDTSGVPKTRLETVLAAQFTKNFPDLMDQPLLTRILEYGGIGISGERISFEVLMDIFAEYWYEHVSTITVHPAIMQLSNSMASFSSTPKQSSSPHETRRLSSPTATLQGLSFASQIDRSVVSSPSAAQAVPNITFS